MTQGRGLLRYEPRSDTVGNTIWLKSDVLGGQKRRRLVAHALQRGSTRHAEIQPRSRYPGLGVSQRMGKRSRLYVISEYPCGAGLPCSSIETNRLSSLVKTICCVFLLL